MDVAKKEETKLQGAYDSLKKKADDTKQKHEQAVRADKVARSAATRTIANAVTPILKKRVEAVHQLESAILIISKTTGEDLEEKK